MTSAPAIPRLSYLQLFPFDFVKIDRPFVNTGLRTRPTPGMMAAMVQMAGSLNLTAIAEIIETEAAARALQEMGCDYGQGYYFSEPIEAELALQRLRTQHPFQPPAAQTGTYAPVAAPATTLRRDGCREAARGRRLADHHDPGNLARLSAARRRFSLTKLTNAASAGGACRRLG